MILLFVEGISNYCIGSMATLTSPVRLGASMIAYSSFPIFMYKIIKEGNGVGLLNVVWNVISSIIGLLIGMFCLGENISKTQLLGAGLGIAALGLVKMG